MVIRYLYQVLPLAVFDRYLGGQDRHLDWNGGWERRSRINVASSDGMVARPCHERRVESVETHGWPYGDDQVVASETNPPGQTWEDFGASSMADRFQPSRLLNFKLRDSLRSLANVVS